MVKLLLQLLVRYIDGDYKRVRESNSRNTIVIYEVTNKFGIGFTRIDIFTKRIGVNNDND